MYDDLLFLSGNDIPFPEAQLNIHVPTIKEIAYIGEENFFTGCEILNISKNMLAHEDKINLENYTNFDILIAILREQNAVMRKNRNCVQMVLALLFPLYTINIGTKEFILKKEGKDEETYFINNSNFDTFKMIINKMFVLKEDESAKFNPAGDMSSKIAEKLRQRHQKLAEQKGPQKIDILSRYVSILAVGEKKDMNSLLNYTVFQLFDEFKRYELKFSYDLFVKAKMAGARDLKDVEDWMQDIHSSQSKNKK